MKFCIISDVHVDITAWDPNRLKSASPDCNTIVVAGDISNDIWITSKWIAELKYHFVNVIWVPGNHDYYNTGFGKSRIVNPELDSKYPYPKLQTEIKEHYSKYSREHGIHCLTRESVVIDGVRFIGATGWHDFIAGEPFSKGDQILAWFNDSNDNMIQWTNKGADPFVLEDEANADCDFIRTAVAESTEPVVVVTHHLPHRQLSVFRPHLITWTKLHGMFANTKMESIIDPKIKYWCYGHTHYGSYREINGINYVCNPVGYPMENRNWQYVELDV